MNESVLHNYGFYSLFFNKLGKLAGLNLLERWKSCPTIWIYTVIL